MCLGKGAQKCKLLFKSANCTPAEPLTLLFVASRADLQLGNTHTHTHTFIHTHKHKWWNIRGPQMQPLPQSFFTPLSGEKAAHMYAACWGFRIMNSDREPDHARTLGEWYQKAFYQHPLGPGFRSETAGNLISRDYNQSESKDWMQSSPGMAGSLSSVTQSQHIKRDWAKCSQHSRCIIMCNQHKMCTSGVAKCAARQWASRRSSRSFQQR